MKKIVGDENFVMMRIGEMTKEKKSIKRAHDQAVVVVDAVVDDDDADFITLPSSYCSSCCCCVCKIVNPSCIILS